MILLASKSVKTGKARITEQVLDEMGRNNAARKAKSANHFAGWKNDTIYRKNGEL